jgi:ketosteroid isomerase-like protein
MSDSMTPEKFLKSYVDQFNKGNISSILTLYESDACFASQPEQIVKGEESIRQSLQSFIDLKGRLESNVKRVFRSSDIALVITEWSFNGIGPDGKAVQLAGKATDVLRQQSDGTWHILIDNPWGTD